MLTVRTLSINTTCEENVKQYLYEIFHISGVTMLVCSYVYIIYYIYMQYHYITINEISIDDQYGKINNL